MTASRADTAADADSTLRLMRPDCYGHDGGAIFLKGVLCACGYRDFPAQRFGCVSCGQTAGLRDVGLRARGRLLACATVHLALLGTPAAPYIVGVVQLDDGPLVRARLQGERLEPGTVVHGAWVPVVAGAPDLFDLAFSGVDAKR